MNAIVVDELLELQKRITNCDLVELSHPLHEAIPTSPSHPGFRMTLARRHGDRVREDGASSANEIIVTGGHVGTHIDALAHVSQDGKLFGDVDCMGAQIGGKFAYGGAESIPPMITRGLLLDIPALTGRPRCDPGEPITAEDLAAAAGAVTPEPGDVVLVRTGWAQLWEHDHPAYLGQEDGAPGVDQSGADWLVDHTVNAVGADTTAFEHIPAGRGHAVMPVHTTLLVNNGIHIIEHLNLEHLQTGATVTQFLFVMLPLRITGGTGSPIRPVALITRTESGAS